MRIKAARLLFEFPEPIHISDLNRITELLRGNVKAATRQNVHVEIEDTEEPEDDDSGD